MINVTSHSHIIDNLISCVTYKIQVSAWTKAGEGDVADGEWTVHTESKVILYQYTLKLTVVE